MAERVGPIAYGETLAEKEARVALMKRVRRQVLPRTYLRRPPHAHGESQGAGLGATIVHFQHQDIGHGGDEAPHAQSLAGYDALCVIERQTLAERALRRKRRPADL